MTSRKRFRLSPALVISCVALFLAIGGTTLATARNTVRSPQIVDGTIRTVDIHDGAVTSAKVADNSLTADDLAANSVGTEEIAPNAVNNAKIAPNAVGATQIAPHAVGAGQLGTVTVRTSSTNPIAAGADGSVSVNCAAGEQVLSGGGQPGNFGVEMTSSIPQSNGWLYQAKNNNGAASTITAYAVCLAG